MANAEVLEFLHKAEQDPALHAEIKAVQVEDTRAALTELARIAERAGYKVSVEELVVGLRESAPRELSDDQLDGVSGGTTTTTITSNQPIAPAPKIQFSAFGSFYPKINQVLDPWGH